MIRLLVGLQALWLVSLSGAQDIASKPAEPGSVVAQLARDAEAVEPLVESAAIKAWCRAAEKLPTVKPLEVKVNDKAIAVDEALYYTGRYGSPLAYARAFDIAAEQGLTTFEQKRVLDFGYGSIGQLRMLALAGADAVGVDVSPLAAAMYADGQGPLGSGKVTVVSGRFPADAEVADAVGGSFDLVISKNTLKRGYVHPAREARPETLIKLGVDDDAFLKAVYDRLNPGGLFLIYNICPARAPADKPYIPWADGESPFSKEDFEAAGFEVLAFDVDDSAVIRKFAQALGWDKQMDLEADLFAWYTVVRRAMR